MKNITQNLTKSIWHIGLLVIAFLFSLTINSQMLGQEYLANPGINTTAIDATTGFDGQGNFNANNGYGGWDAGTGGSYASATTANGTCQSEDRMFKMFKTGGTDGQFIRQTITALPAGNYNFGFWNKWDATSSTGEALPTWSAEDDITPKFTIKVQNADGGWVTVFTHIPAEPTSDMTWIEETGSWTNDETRDVRVMFYKNGGTSAAPTNLNNLWYLDTTTFNYVSAPPSDDPTCTHTLLMVDSYGDGWNGNTVDVLVNGVVVLEGQTIASGSAAEATFQASTGDVITLTWVEGTYTSEVSWSVTDGEGTEIAAGAYGADAAVTGYCTPPATQTTHYLSWVNDGSDAGQALTIQVGDTVEWTWGAGTHNLVSTSGVETFDSGYESSGFVWSHTFTVVGSTDYICSPHATNMYGTITATAAPSSNLALQGIIDIDGGFKKAVHVRATEDIADLSVYKLQAYNNANSSPGGSYILSGSASAGDDILIANDGDALDAYMSTSTIFDFVFNTGSFPSINGDDSIELLMNDSSVEVFGDPGTDGTGEPWEYTNSWAYKVDDTWTYGGVGCTDGSDITWESSCVYPLAIGQEPVPSVTITMDDDTISENGEVSVITATLSNVHSQPTIIPLTISGTATLDIDYSTDFVSGSISGILAGGNGSGSANNQFNFESNPYGSIYDGGEIEVDSSGNIYIADTQNNRVIKWAPGANEGTVVAGGNGAGSNLNQLNNPTDIHVDSSGNLYVLDTFNNRIVIWAPDSTVGVLRVDKNNGAWSWSNSFFSFDVDISGNVYTTDWNDYVSKVHKWADASDPTSFSLITDMGESAVEIEIDDSNNIYVITNGNYVKKKLSGVDGWEIVAAGFGVNKRDFQVDSAGNIYVYDSNNNWIMKWSPGASVYDAVLVKDELSDIVDINLDELNNIYFTDRTSNAIKKIQISPAINIVAGSSTGSLTFTGIEDSVYDEGNETIILTPSTPANGTLASSDSITISIINYNYAPVVNNHSILLAEQGTVSVLENGETTLLYNASDVEGDDLVVILVTEPSNGILNLNSDGTFSYEHDGTETTSDSFTYKASDGNLESEVAITTITITNVNDNTPTDIVLSNNTINENESNLIIGQFSAIDVDLPSDSHIFELVSGSGDDDNVSFIINGNSLENMVSFDFETQNEYSIRVRVTDENNESYEKILNINVLNINDINISFEKTNTSCSGDIGDGSITIDTISEVSGDLTFLWTTSNGGVIPSGQETNQNLSDLKEGIYTVLISDATEFTYTENFEINLIPQYSDLNICYVSNDPNNPGNNLVFLNNQGNYNVDYYQILRETSVSSVYEAIGLVENNENSFLDESSNNQSQVYKYKVQSVDNCGSSSSESTAHETILLQSSLSTNSSVNLSWTDYYGTDYSSYYIYRKVNDGDFEEIASLSSSNNTYTDANSNVDENSYQYYVSIVIDNCDVQGRFSSGASTNNSLQIKSNFENLGGTFSTPDFENHQIEVFPNPTSLYWKVKSPKIIELSEVYDLLGKKIISKQHYSKEVNIDGSVLPSGVYILIINNIYEFRLVKK